MSDFLQDLDKLFNEVKDKEGVYENLPDGEYMADFVDVKFGDSKKGIPMVTMRFRITHGEYEDKEHRKFMMLAGDDKTKTEQALQRFSREMKSIGIDTSKGLQGIIDAFPTLEGVPVKLTLKTTISKTSGKEFLNTAVEVLG